MYRQAVAGLVRETGGCFDLGEAMDIEEAYTLRKASPEPLDAMADTEPPPNGTPYAHGQNVRRAEGDLSAAPARGAPS
jgi:hypothetical protein